MYSIDVTWDVAWLRGVKVRKAAAEIGWQREVRSFLQHSRGAGAATVGRVQRSSRVPGTPAADVDDILAVADAKFFAGLDAYEGDAQPLTYYLSIVLRTAISFYRRSSERRELTASELTAGDGRSPLDGRASDHDEVHRWGLWRDLNRALAELYRRSPRLASAFDLYHVQQIGDAQTCAAQLGIDNVNNFHQQLSRARRLLQEILARGGYEP